MRSRRPSLAPSVSAVDSAESGVRERGPPAVGLIVLPRRVLGESPFTNTSLPCSSTCVAIWARNGVDSAKSAPATSTATGMQFLFMVTIFASAFFQGADALPHSEPRGRQSALLPFSNERHKYGEEGGFSGVSIWHNSNYSNRSSRG